MTGWTPWRRQERRTVPLLEPWSPTAWARDRPVRQERRERALLVALARRQQEGDGRAAAPRAVRRWSVVLQPPRLLPSAG